MSGPWSAEQQAWLAALGHRVLVLAGDETAAPFAEAPVHGYTAEPMRSASVRDATAGPGLGASASPAAAPDRAHADAATGRRQAPPRIPLEGDMTVAASRRTASPRAPEDALERALLRATGQRTRSEARALLERLGVDVPSLRGDPRAKRALWRQLRPLQPRFRP